VTWLYLALDLGALAGPLALSFDRRVAFYRNYPQLFAAIGAMMVVFVPWDMAFVAKRVWGFDPRYVLGPTIGNLPIEEWLFFPVVSYACVFIYECVRYYVPDNPLERWHRPILLAIAVLGMVIALSHPSRLYTCLKVGTASLALLAILYWIRPPYLARLLLTYLISLVPFFMMNSILTGSLIEGQVVWYSPAHISGIRVGTIPIEDGYYNLMMLMMTIVVYESLRRRRPTTVR
jgi:lycopene cyclase domain-containing protein